VRILIIGGTAFMGPHVVEGLAAAGHEITVFHRGEHEPKLPGNVKHVHSPAAGFPVTNFPIELLRWHPDTVLHMVAMGEQDAEAAVRAFRGIARRLIVCSSGDVYAAYGVLIGTENGIQQRDLLTEDAPLRKNLYPYRKIAKNPDDWLYQYEKILVEKIVMGDSELRGTILRLPAVYGPGDNRHGFFPNLKRMDDGRRVIFLDHDYAGWRWTHGYVENVAAAILLAVFDEQAAGRTYNVGERFTPTAEERVRLLAQIAGWNGEIVKLRRAFLPKHLQDAYNYSCDLAYDTSRIRHDLGYEETVSLQEGMRRTVDSLRLNPPSFDPSQYDYAAEDGAIVAAQTTAAKHSKPA
jgi:nucleoside-diphosphate-sugar epimerase